MVRSGSAARAWARAQVERVDRDDLVHELARLELAQPGQDRGTDEPVGVRLVVVEVAHARELRVEEVLLVQLARRLLGVLQGHPAHDRADPVVLRRLGEHRVGVRQVVGRLDEDRPVHAGCGSWGSSSAGVKVR